MNDDDDSLLNDMIIILMWTIFKNRNPNSNIVELCLMTIKMMVRMKLVINITKK